MNIANSLLRELEIEEKTTRKVLERLPVQKLTWKPHGKSMSAGLLAMHIASTPGAIAKSVVTNSYPVESFVPETEPANCEVILQAHEASMAAAKEVLSGLDDTKATEQWTLTAEGNPIITMPRFEWIRIYMLNHWYHHRGQLAVYLRELDVPVPAMYGPSADEAG